MTKETETLLQLLGQQQEQMLAEWLQEAGAASTRLTDANRRVMRTEAEEILSSLRTGLQGGGDPDNLQQPAWAPLRQTLESLSRTRAAQGQSAGDTPPRAAGSPGSAAVYEVTRTVPPRRRLV